MEIYAEENIKYMATMFDIFGKNLPILSRVLVFLRSAQLEQQTSDKAKYACKRQTPQLMLAGHHYQIKRSLRHYYQYRKISYFRRK